MSKCLSQSPIQMNERPLNCSKRGEGFQKYPLKFQDLKKSLRHKGICCRRVFVWVVTRPTSQDRSDNVIVKICTQGSRTQSNCSRNTHCCLIFYWRDNWRHHQSGCRIEFFMSSTHPISMPRIRYSEEVKQRVITLVLESNTPVTQVTRDIGCSPFTSIPVTQTASSTRRSTNRPATRRLSFPSTSSTREIIPLAAVFVVCLAY